MSVAEFNKVLKKAHYSDISERYEEMAEEMKLAIKLAHKNNLEITLDARNLFSLAYKNLVSVRRSSWRVLNSEKNKNSEDKEIIEEKLRIIEKELNNYCTDVLNTMENYITVTKEDISLFVFIMKMKGDYNRYKAEIANKEDQERISKEASNYYITAKDVSQGLGSTDPVRLGVYLNYSVFCYEILNDCDKACVIAREAFDKAIEELDTLKEDCYKDSTLIMQLLRDNLTLWTSRNETKTD